MIGQRKNKKLLIKWQRAGIIPRFILIEGDEGSGRLTLAKEIIKIVKGQGIIAGNSIAEVREIINNAYAINNPVCYIFRDCDSMSIQAKNSLLKVVEEPPNNAYFIMTIKSQSDMLQTIKSRATLIKMQPYSQDELNSLNLTGFQLKYINTPGLAKRFDNSQINEVEGSVLEVIEALRNKSGLQLLKESYKVKDKLDLDLFMRVFIVNYPKDLSSETTLNIICKFKNQLKRTGIDKKACIESMLISLLKELKRVV